MRERGKNRIADMVLVALFAVLIAICSWVSVPGPVPFTMQTFGVFLALSCLGGRRGTLSVLVYLLLGLIGVPVFAGFSGGIGSLIGSTGGYLLGFLLSALLVWALEKMTGRCLWAQVLAMTLAMLVCYAFGTVWYMAVYLRTTGAIGVWSVLGACVVPFLIPDAVKIALAMLLGRRLKPLLDRQGG